MAINGLQMWFLNLKRDYFGLLRLWFWLPNKFQIPQSSLYFGLHCIHIQIISGTDHHCNQNVTLMSHWSWRPYLSLTASTHGDPHSWFLLLKDSSTSTWSWHILTRTNIGHITRFPWTWGWVVETTDTYVASIFMGKSLFFQ